MISDPRGLSWLHLTDLHVRSLGTLWQRSHLRPELERDLARMHEVAGPFDLVLITGDIATAGADAEYGVASEGLLSLLDFLKSLGSDPSVLAVPGNHDLVHTAAAQAPNADSWESDVTTREAFFTDPHHPTRKIVESAFASFMQWAKNWSDRASKAHKLEIQAGLLPGDFVATVTKKDQRFGIVGLNTAFLEVASFNAFGAVDVDFRQIENGIKMLEGSNDGPIPTVLITHHSPQALSVNARKRLHDTISPACGPSVHLCGTIHGISLRQIALNSTVFSARPFSGALEARAKRGYACGRIESAASAAQPTLKIWPRILLSESYGASFGPDSEYNLGSDEAITKPLPARASASASASAPATAPASAPATASARAPVPASAPQRRSLSASAHFEPDEPVARPSLPSGLSLLRSLPLDRSPLARVRFSPMGDSLAVLSYWGRVFSWDTKSYKKTFAGRTNSEAMELCYSADGKHLATRAGTHLSIWDTSDGTCLRTALEVPGVGLAWAPDGVLAAGTPTGKILFFDADDLSLLGDTDHGFCPEGIFALAFSPDGEFLLSGGKGDGFIAISTIPAGALPQNGFTRAAHFHRGSVLDFAFRPRSNHVASCADDGTIAVWSLEDGSFLARLEGHLTAVTSLSFSFDGRLLASRSRDGVVLLWRTDAWEQVAKLQSATTSLAGAAFSPVESILAIPSPTGNITLLSIDIDVLRGRSPAVSTLFTTTAKVVLLGEGRAGKSCLGLRLAEDRFEEQASTHGMRFWTVPEERLPRVTSGPKNHKRELVVWDLGGQEEYRLVHPLFLHDTELALLVFEPGRGKAAELEISTFNDHLVDDDEHGEPPRRLLVGTKLDSDAAPEDPAAIERLRLRTGALGYVRTSARENRGIAELKELIAMAIDWTELGPTSRPALFERIRTNVERARKAGRVVLSLSELEATVRAEHPNNEEPLESAAVAAVASQLARQGLVADIRLSDGTRALVLDVEQIARYASSLILLARQNPHGVPALDIASLLGPNARFPRIPQEERLRRDQELGVVDGVISLFLEHGTCFLHEGLLVFPALFPTGSSDESSDEAKLPAAITYEMSRPTAEVFASAVAALALSRRFGPARLGFGRADFGRPSEGLSRLSMHPAPQGKARGALAISFSGDTPDEVRRLFAGFLEDHLKQRGVHFVEKSAIRCNCGHDFDPEVVSRRLVAGHSDVGCPACDTRMPLVPKDPSGKPIDAPIYALRREADRRREESVEAARIVMTTARIAEKHPKSPLRILHLSDLHFREDDDPEAKLLPLCIDLRDRIEGLALEKLDFVAISGDLTNRASQGELEKARIFLSRLLEEMGLSAERCLVVPGNHDLNWDVEVYPFRSKRAVDAKRLAKGTFVEQANGYLVRDDTRYPERFRNFSQHLYHPLFLREYPLAPLDQGITTLFAPERIQFIALNSAFEIDEFFGGRSGIHDGALSRALDAGDKQVRDAQTRGDLAKDAKTLRISLFHHPVTGQDLMADCSFLEKLRKSDVKIALHGHVHEERAALEGHLAPVRKLHVVGAGSFGAPGSHRPESVPRLYNLLTIERDLSRMRVDTRALRKNAGAWEAWAAWPGKNPGEKRAFYEVDL